MKNTHLFLSIALLVSMMCNTRAMQTRGQKKRQQEEQQSHICKPWKTFCADLLFESEVRRTVEVMQNEEDKIEQEKKDFKQRYDNLNSTQQTIVVNMLNMYAPNCIPPLIEGNSTPSLLNPRKLAELIDSE